MLQRGNAARDALASRTAGAVLRRSHAERGNENGRGTEYSQNFRLCCILLTPNETPLGTDAAIPNHGDLLK